MLIARDTSLYIRVQCRWAWNGLIREVGSYGGECERNSFFMTVTLLWGRVGMILGYTDGGIHELVGNRIHESWAT